ncbi:MAG: hypothetical protein M1355_03405 [Patescibacteria group bacterium]|nr:hypothetical protein [Patescibacteria group bacterium]
MQGKLRSFLRILLITALAIFLNGEYFAHGPTLLTQGVLILFYFLYILTLENAIRTFKLTDRQLFLAGAIFGFVVEGFLHRSFYAAPPLFLGINWFIVAVQIIAWGLMATVLPFYFGGKFLPRKEEKLGSKWPFFVFLALFLTLLLFWQSQLGPLNNPAGGFVLLLILIFTGLFYWDRQTKSEFPLVKENQIFNVIIIAYLLTQAVVGTTFKTAGSGTYVISIILIGPITYLLFWRKKRLPI